jgi:crossover junction endodeoxyribonuclease RuvC
MIILGIDPGKTGGIAHISTLTCNMSNREMETYSFKDRSYTEIADYMARYTRIDVKAYLEKVHSMPAQGVSSSFKFGEGFGALQGMLAAYEIPFEFVTPQKWQKELSIPKRTKMEKQSDFKRRLKDTAQRLYPIHVKKIDSSTADAVLIMHYGLKLNGEY